MKKNCKNCGKSFETHRKNKVHCSDECRVDYKRKLVKAEVLAKNCKQCGKLFEGTRGKVFCSKRCAVTHEDEKKLTGKPFGRPSKYKREYCQKLFDHMAGGLSFESFAGEIFVTVSTLYHWEQNHKEFLDAKRLGRAASQGFWEKMGRSGAAGKIKNFNYGAWYRNSVARFPEMYRDKVEVVTRDETMKNPEDMSDKELSERISHALAVVNKYESTNDTGTSSSSIKRTPAKAKKKTTGRKRSRKSD